MNIQELPLLINNPDPLTKSFDQKLDLDFENVSPISQSCHINYFIYNCSGFLV